MKKFSDAYKKLLIGVVILTPFQLLLALFLKITIIHKAYTPRGPEYLIKGMLILNIVTSVFLIFSINKDYKKFVNEGLINPENEKITGLTIWGIAMLVVVVGISLWP